MQRKDRRRFLKQVGAVGLVGSMAGCLGGGGGQATSSPTSTQPPGDLAPDEWRDLASEKAKAELEGSDELLITTAHQEIQDKWVTTAYSQVDDAYGPLEGNVNVQIAGDDDTTTKYARANNTGGAGFDLINMGGMFELMTDEDIEFGSIADTPAVRTMPDQAKIGPSVPAWIDVGGVAYNTEVTETPPETFDDLLEPEFGGGEIVIDFTPPITHVGAYMELKGDQYIEDVAAQEPSFEKILPNSTKKCANGDAKVSFVNLATHTFGHIEDGKPIEPTAPDMWFNRPKPVVVSAFSEHPWSAKLWIDHALREDNERWMVENQFGMVSARGNESFPEEVAKYAGEKMWSPLEFDRTPSELLKHFQQLIGAPV